MKYLFMFLILISSTQLFFAQSEECSCCKENYKQFDFWLGDWDVYDIAGNKVGENIIVKLLDNCVVQENWISENMSGTSYNYFNSKDSTWNQLWLDNFGGALILRGEFADGKMIMRSQLLKGEKIDLYYNRIIWEETEDGTVIQTWETFDENDQLIAEVFKGIYKRKE